jgi:dolichol-phosphate mannosyltransferase
VGIVTPLANEMGTIQALLDGVVAQLGPEDRAFYVFDRACKDGTREFVERYAKTEPRVVAVWAPESRCGVDAYFEGYRAALADGCDLILEMDGGLSHRPDQIPRFREAMKPGIEYATGCRFIRGGSFRGSWTRKLISRGGTILTNLLMGTRMYDMTSGFECFTRSAMQTVLSRGVKSRAHFFQTEIRLMLRDWPWVEVPIDYTNPSNSVGKKALSDAFAVLWRLYRDDRAARRAAIRQARANPGMVEAAVGEAPKVA